jgi:hypothetical protein
VLNKEIGVNNDFEKVCCKVIEIIIFADWEKEYKRAKNNSVIVATFSQLNNGSIQWKPLSEFNKLSRQIAISSWRPYDPILSTSLEQFFFGWLVSQEFAESLSLRSRKLEYLPALVKLLLRYMSYTAERTETELLGIDMQVSLNEVAKTYKSLISGLVQDTPHMKQIYEVD